MPEDHLVDIGLDQPIRMPLGDDPDHCERYRWAAERRERQANCEHPDDRRVEVTTLGDLPHLRYICGRCGLNWLEDV